MSSGFGSRSFGPLHLKETNSSHLEISWLEDNFSFELASQVRTVSFREGIALLTKFTRIELQFVVVVFW